MSLNYLGSLGLEAVLPGVPAALSVSLQDFQARIDALLAWSPGEVNFAAQLELAQSIVVGIQASIAAGITPPSISAQIALVAGLLAALEAQLKIILTLKNLMATAGVDLYSWDGRVDALGPALTGALAGGLPSGGTGATHCNALVLITSLAATWTAMGGIFLTA